MDNDYPTPAAAGAVPDDAGVRPAVGALAVDA